MRDCRLLRLPWTVLSNRVVSPSPDDGDQICVAEMQRLLAKVSEMCSQRTTLSESLRRAVHADDVTTALVTHAGANKDVRHHRVVMSSCRHVVMLSRRHVISSSCHCLTMCHHITSHHVIASSRHRVIASSRHRVFLASMCWKPSFFDA